MMRELIENSAFLGVVITIGSFELGRAIRKKWNFALFNPLLLAILFSIGVLLLFRIDYGSYLNGAKYINFLLTLNNLFFYFRNITFWLKRQCSVYYLNYV